MLTALENLTEWYFGDEPILSMPFYVTATFQWYFTEVAIFRLYRTNFPFV